MLPVPPAPLLDADDLAVVRRARDVVTGLLDDLRPLLLANAGDSPTERKGDGSPVTDADLESDRRIHHDLTAAFPDHAVVTEEGNTRWEGERWTWVVDPIDGTSNYSAGVPYWCVSIALCLDGMPVLGVVDAPSLDQRHTAVAGHGGTRTSRGTSTALAVAPSVDFRSGRNGHVPVAVSAGTIRRATGRVRLNPRILGAHALDLAQVASGALAGAWARNPKAWDVAAGIVLVREAGGVVLQEDRGLLPLRRGVDLARASAGTLAGPEAGWLSRLHDALDG